MSESSGWWWHRSIDRDAAGNFKGVRAWLHRRAGGEVSTQIAVGGDHRSVGMHVDGGEGSVAAHVAFGGLWLSVSSERIAPDLLYRLLGVYYDRSQTWDYEAFKACDRSIDLSIHGGSLWWTLWMNRDEWRSTDPKWRRGHLDPVEALLGRARVESRIERTDDVEIPLPEGPVRALAQWKIYTAARPRWPFPRHWRSVTIEPEKPVGVPGKGENSYDCGDDAIYSQSTSSRDNEEAIARFVESTLRTRRRYGGSHRFEPSDPPATSTDPAEVSS